MKNYLKALTWVARIAELFDAVSDIRGARPAAFRSALSLEGKPGDFYTIWVPRSMNSDKLNEAYAEILYASEEG